LTKRSQLFRDQGYLTWKQTNDYIDEYVRGNLLVVQVLLLFCSSRSCPSLFLLLTTVIRQGNQLLQQKELFNLDLLQLLKEKGYYAVHLLRKDPLRIELSHVVSLYSGDVRLLSCFNTRTS